MTTEENRTPGQPPDLSSRRHAASRIAEEGGCEIIRWNGTTARCLCPLGHVSTLYVDDSRHGPHLHCFGGRARNCADQVAEINAQLHFLRSGEVKADPVEARQRARLRQLQAQARNRVLPLLLKQPGVPLEHWTETSPIPIPADPDEHWRLFLAAMFKPDDIVWIGHLHDSGKAEHAIHFKRVRDWLSKRQPYGPQLGQSTYTPAINLLGFDSSPLFERTQKRIRTIRYFVAEADRLPGTNLPFHREQFGNVIKWLMQIYVLRAIVDTGGKSLHAWFERLRRPEQQANQVWHVRRQENEAVMQGLGCDPGMWQFSATARLPGYPRLDGDGNETGRWQHLLYFNPTNATNL